MRLAWKAIGWTAVGLAVVGTALPIVPTVPFLLVAAYAFARGSPRAHFWLMRHPRLGPPLRDWHRHGVVPARAKALAVAGMAASLAGLAFWGAPAWALALQTTALAGVSAFLLTRPSEAPRP